MVAYAALLSLKFTINQIQQHPQPPISLHHQQLLSLNEKLDFLQYFLESFSKELEGDELESRIADAAYAAEDVIESHIVDQIPSQNISCLDLYEGLGRVTQHMDLIKNEVMEMVEVKKMGAELHHQLIMISTDSSVLRMHNNFMADFGEILNDVMYKLTRKDSNLEIIPIVGIGGIGKTTLAKTIYARPLLVQRFNILAWVTISQEYNVSHILSQVLYDEETKGGQVHELGERVHKKLFGRRYLIVMDDIWSIEAWDKVKSFFPNNRNGSKIMITTRNSKLGFQLSGSHDFQMKFLDDVKSWDLLCNIVFGKECCPVELEDTGKEIVRNCRGLPLSIVVIGGLLTKSNKTTEYWQYTLENLNSQINLENNEHCLQILRRSYKELPIHLKPCFLYMGVFPEDHEIYVPKLIKLWVAEGFLKPSKNRSLEEVAKECLKELTERNLISVHKLGWNGKAKLCKIHDLLRDLGLREAKRQRFFCVLSGQDVSGDINMQRRICIHDNTTDEVSPKLTHIVESASLIRSLCLFIDGLFCIPSLSFTCRLLRVLSCFGYNSSLYRGIVEDAEALYQLANLRYVSLLDLSLRALKESRNFPTPLYLLWNLQTLDGLQYNMRSPLAPSGIWRMCHLRQVKFPEIQLSNAPFREDDFVLENLQTLSCVDNSNCSEEVAERIPNIKKLKIILYEHRLEEEGLPSFNLCHLRNLESLELDVSHGYSNLKGMQNLNLPHSLTKLSMCGTLLIWNDLNTKIGLLPHLQVLHLKLNSCVGSEWETIDGQFHSLKLLRIEECSLKCWTSDDTHFPRLEHLVLQGLFMLEEIPLSIGDIATFQSIQLKDCSESVVASAERIKEEQLSYGNEDLQVLFGTNLSPFIFT